MNNNNSILAALLGLVLGIAVGAVVGYQFGYNEGAKVNTLKIGDFHLQWKEQPQPR